MTGDVDETSALLYIFCSYYSDLCGSLLRESEEEKTYPDIY